MDPFLITFAAIGFFVVGSRIFSFVRLVLSLFVLPGKALRSFGPKGSWALVTGASDGLGKQYALQLASAGFNVVLVSRTESKLEDLAKTIESTYKVKTRNLAMNFADNHDPDYARLDHLISDLDVAILINNVGKSHDIPVTFAETAPEEMRDIITINCTGTLRTTAIVLPGMMSRKRGLILTMGSFGGLLPTPLLATYSGSKAFLQQWSSSLGAEVAPYGITVELVQSYLVTSAMSKIRRPTMTIPTARAFVKAVIGKIGRSGGAQGWAYTSTPYWSHGIMQWLLSTFVGLSNRLVVEQNKGMHEAIRKRALRKRERESGKKIS